MWLDVPGMWIGSRSQASRSSWSPAVSLEGGLALTDTTYKIEEERDISRGPQAAHQSRILRRLSDLVW